MAVCSVWRKLQHWYFNQPIKEVVFTSYWNTFIQPFSLYSPFLTSSNICHMSEGIWTRVEHRTPQWSHFVGTIHCEAGHNNPGSPGHCWHTAQRLMDLFFVSWNWNRLLLINLVRTRFLSQYFYLKLSGKTGKYIPKLKLNILDLIHNMILSLSTLGRNLPVKVWSLHSETRVVVVDSGDISWVSLVARWRVCKVLGRVPLYL